MNPINYEVKPRAWLLEPKVQRYPHKPIQRDCFTEEPDQEQRECAVFDGDRYVPVYSLTSTHAEFEVRDESGCVAWGGEGPRDEILQEALHYAMIAGQDGPVTVFEVLRVPVKLSTNG